MGDLGDLTSQLISSSFARDVILGVPCLDAAFTMGLNHCSVARNLDKPTQNKLKTNKQIIYVLGSFSLHRGVSFLMLYFGSRMFVRRSEVSVIQNCPLMELPLYSSFNSSADVTSSNF